MRYSIRAQFLLRRPSQIMREGRLGLQSDQYAADFIERYNRSRDPFFRNYLYRVFEIAHRNS